MSGLTASRLLEIWERGVAQSPVQRALELLSAAYPNEKPGDLADLTIGQRDARLLQLRQSLFGPQLNSLADCPACSERVEMTFQVGDLIPGAGSEAAAEESLHFKLDDLQVAFRLPSSRDLQAIDPGGTTNPRRMLAERCVLEATRAGQGSSLAELPEAVVDKMGSLMSETDPLADIWLTLACPVCGHTWQAAFDIVSYLWSEIETWAYRTLKEVDSLAKAYGWSEEEILRLSAWRRHFYISQL